LATLKPPGNVARLRRQTPSAAPYVQNYRVKSCRIFPLATFPLTRPACARPINCNSRPTSRWMPGVRGV